MIVYIGDAAKRLVISPFARPRDWFLEIGPPNKFFACFVAGSFEPVPNVVGIATDNIIGFISGLVPANGADTDHDIDFGTGRAISTDGSNALVMASVLTKQIDAVFAVGNNAGGRFTGSLLADTVYHLFTIRRDSDGLIDSGFDTSVIAANIPAGFTAFRRTGSILTDGAANIEQFSAREIEGGGLEVLWLDPPLDVDATTALTATTRTLSVPIDYKVQALMNVFVNEALTYFSSFDVNDEAPSITAAPLSTIPKIGSGHALISVRTNTSAQIRERSDLSGKDVRIATLGWVDSRR